MEKKIQRQVEEFNGNCSSKFLQVVLHTAFRCGYNESQRTFFFNIVMEVKLNAKPFVETNENETLIVNPLMPGGNKKVAHT